MFKYNEFCQRCSRPAEKRKKSSRQMTVRQTQCKLLTRFHLKAAIYTASQKYDTDVAHYNFNAHQPILVIFDITGI